MGRVKMDFLGGCELGLDFELGQLFEHVARTSFN